MIAVGSTGRQALVLADEPARTCYLQDSQTFVRWLAANSEAELINAAKALLDDPGVGWQEYGPWETDGPAVLMDSVNCGTELQAVFPDGTTPEHASIPKPPGRWRVRAVHVWADEETSVSPVQLCSPSPS